MRNDIFYLMASGLSLTRRMRDMLFETACVMLKHGTERVTVDDIEFDGEVRTTFMDKTLGSVGGVEFIASISTDHGTGKVKYLVRPTDADIQNEGEWVSHFSIQQMAMELDSPPSRKTPQYN